MKAIELEKAFDPKGFEDRIYGLWVERGAFAPAASAGAPFVVALPPPNVTGVLHIGHALNVSLQDSIVRFQRMRGRPALWVPGTDHAGIATQNVVERVLRARGVSRRELGREGFVAEAWRVKGEHHALISNQIRKMGASVDWSRERFTLDAGLSRAVREVFVSLFERGLVYRGEYLVNWCSSCGTALADDEVVHAEMAGKMYFIRYPLVDGGGFVEVATTRPETMLGDAALAVHGEDERYRHLVGSLVRLPLTERVIPIVADAYVDRAFGTGVVKITPAHDVNDWELGKRHGLPVLNILTEGGTLNENAPERFRGMPVAEARAAVVAELEAGGFLIREEAIRHSVGRCYRCDTVVEPFLSEQWFVRMKPLAEKALACWRRGEVVFHPKKWENTFRRWLEGIRDWCISRQLWWGHRIPAWTCTACGKVSVSREDIACCPQCGGAVCQDEDVLDTWFSSWLWPFSTLGWPEGGEGEAGGATDAERDKAILTGEPVAKVFSKDLPIQNGKIRDTALNWIKRNPLGPAHTEIGVVQISNNSIKDSFSKAHFVYPNKLYVLPALKTALEKGAYLGAIPNFEGKAEMNHYFAAPVELDGQRKLIFVRVINKNSRQLNVFYLHQVYVEGEIKKVGSVQTAAALLKRHIGSFPSLNKSLIHDALFVKPPSAASDFERFYPTSALITAYDIIFFWVSRMIMAGLEFTGKAPFHDVYIHGLVRDKQGRKMSKSLGNGIDPLELVEEYGADALKFTLSFLCAQGQDILIDKESFKLGSKFANKVWNASRYILMNLEGRTLVEDPPLLPIDRWMRSRLAGAAKTIAAAFEQYRFNEAAAAAHEFFWNDFCDWYVEATKLSTKAGDDAEKDRAVSVLLDALAESLKLLHPLLPFVTEEIYGKLPDGVKREGEELLIVARFPQGHEALRDEKNEADFAFLQEIVRAVRTLRSECTVPPEKRLRVRLALTSDKKAFIAENRPLMLLLAGLRQLDIDGPASGQHGAIGLAGDGFEAFVFIAEAVDVKLLKSRWQKELEKDVKFAAGLEAKLANESFVKNAPAELVEGEKEKLERARSRCAKLSSYIESCASEQ
ncbi:MAG: valine--tRNA ligase [Spirochaetaceae bacterium]|nr:valine--tRNA ligase [Spirochaetaceae bacterium]